MPIVLLNVSNNFNWVLQSIGVLSVQCSVFRVQGESAIAIPQIVNIQFGSGFDGLGLDTIAPLRGLLETGACNHG